MKTFAVTFGVLVLAPVAALLTQCSSSSSDSGESATDGGRIDSSIGACPSIEPELNTPCPTQEGLACTFGCDGFLCKNALWNEQGSVNDTTDGGGCPTDPPIENTPCLVARCASVVICQYRCENQLGFISAQCETSAWLVDNSDPRCAVDLDAAADLDAGDASD